MKYKKNNLMNSPKKYEQSKMQQNATNRKDGVYVE